MSSILVNNILEEKSPILLDRYTEPRIFLNIMIQYKYILSENAILQPVDENYKFRPDRLAYDLWGQDLWYPAILVVNNLGSVLQFNPDLMGQTCLVPTDDNLARVLKIIQAKTNNIKLSNI